jgi:hypothetical protein
MTTRRIAIIAAALVLGCAPSTFAQTAATPAVRSRAASMPRDVLAAQQFVFDAYPDLLTRAVTVQLRSVNGQIVVSVADTQTGTDPQAAPPALVNAIVEFDTAGQLRRYQASGALLDQTRNDLLRKQRLEHPDWSDGDLDAWLATAGGTSTRGTPPTSVLAAAGPAQRWRRFLGSDAAAAGAAFRWKADRAAAGPSATDAPAWLVNATAAGPKGEALHYQLAYEPFGGRLIAVVRQ